MFFRKNHSIVGIASRLGLALVVVAGLAGIALTAGWVNSAQGPAQGQPVQAKAERAGDEWVSLFNGKTLDGWTPKFKGKKPGVNVKDTFRAEDGKIIVSYENYDRWHNRRGTLLYDSPYSHYRLRLEYRFTGEQVPGGPGWAFRNNGIMFHADSPQAMARNEGFPDCLETQLLGGRAEGKRPTANLCTPGTHVHMNGKLRKKHCMKSSSKTYRGDQWVSVEIVVRGDQRVRHLVNGKQVMTYTKPVTDEGEPVKRGWIGLQAESHPTEFRNIELKKIDPEAPVDAGPAAE